MTSEKAIFPRLQFAPSFLTKCTCSFLLGASNIISLRLSLESIISSIKPTLNSPLLLHIPLLPPSLDSVITLNEPASRSQAYIQSIF